MLLFFQDDQDVRTCIVHFVMSFLLAGDNGVIRKLVEQKSEYLAFNVQNFTLMSSEIIFAFPPHFFIRFTYALQQTLLA